MKRGVGRVLRWVRWDVVQFAALMLVCVAAAIGGAFVTVRAFAGTVEPFALGTVRVTALPTLDGRVDVYVPIVDWGVRAFPYEAPVAIEVRFRSLDRDQAEAALRSGSAAQERLAQIRTELAQAGRDALRRTALLGIAGGIGGGLLGGGVIGAAFHRRRWLLDGAIAGALVPLAFGLVVLATLRNIDYSAFERPTFYAHGRELPRLLSFSEQLLTANESYTESYEQALAGLANLVAFASEGDPPGTPTESVVLGSDLHGNSLVLPVLEAYTEDKPVFLAGDFTLLGATPESELVPLLRDVGAEVVAVSGNHDSRPFMLDLAEAGVVVLTRDGRLAPDGTTDGVRVIDVDGLAVAGYDDPLEGGSATVEGRQLELSEEELEAEREDFLAWFEALPERPDVVLVHQHGLAHGLFSALGQEEPQEEPPVEPPEDEPPLLIFTGHDHKQHIHENDGAILVDGGTVGAGGPFAIGVQSAGFAEVHFSGDGVLRAIDLIEVEPLSGNARASRTVFESPTP